LHSEKQSTRPPRKQLGSGMIRGAFEGDDLLGSILGVVADGVDNDAPAKGTVVACRAGLVGAGDLKEEALGVVARRSNRKMADGGSANGTEFQEVSPGRVHWWDPIREVRAGESIDRNASDNLSSQPDASCICMDVVDF